MLRIFGDGVFPWWPFYPIGLVMTLGYWLTYPVAVFPFHATCHEDLYGAPPAESCVSYWCPHLDPNWEPARQHYPQCVEWWQQHSRGVAEADS